MRAPGARNLTLIKRALAKTISSDQINLGTLFSVTRDQGTLVETKFTNNSKIGGEKGGKKANHSRETSVFPFLNPKSTLCRPHGFCFGKEF